jgi:ribosomal protein S18 acetylase RimI-like enzyme
VIATVRPLRLDDMDAVRRIDAAHASSPERAASWGRIADDFLARPGERRRLALAAEFDGHLAGFLFGEVRAFEFGSEPCGWILAVGVDPARERSGAASALLDEACLRFEEAGVHRVRTMVRRNDVPMLAFFRSNDFVGGAFVQLETGLDARAAMSTPEEDAA